MNSMVLSHYLDNEYGIQNLSPSNMEVFNAVIGRLRDFKVLAMLKLEIQVTS